MGKREGLAGMNHREFIGRCAVAAAALAILAGCDTYNYQSLDLGTDAIKQDAAKLSVGDAVGIVDHGIGNYGGYGVLEFTPKQFVDYTEDFGMGGTTDDKVVGYDTNLHCPFEMYAPYDATTDVADYTGGNILNPIWVATRLRGVKCDINALPLEIHVHTPAEAAKVAEAFWRLGQSTLAEREAWVQRQAGAFAQVAANYRAADPKPQITEAVHRFAVIAGAKVRDKRFVEAAIAYENGLKLAPWWPQGQFDAALALGEARDYQGAIRHMKNYLALVADAPDARKAQDKIYEWQAAGPAS
jgi:hypothetical protein